MDKLTDFLSSSLSSYLDVMSKFSADSPTLFYAFTVGASLMMILAMIKGANKKEKDRNIFDINARIKNPSWYSVSISAVIVFVLMIPIKLLSFFIVAFVNAVIFMELKIKGYK